MVDDETLRSIEKLHQLKSDGVITEEDFEKSKERMLFGAREQPAARTVESASRAADDPFAWITMPLKRYAEFTGRSSRREFWMFQLIYVALFVVTVIVVAADTDFGITGSIGNMMIAICVIALLGLLVPLLALEARRFHDQNMSGWFTLINLVPYLGPLVVMVFMFIEGTHGENQYGPDPIDR
jgi:uncharacterized membrane protein YhaH (DUF805 family)